MFSFAEDWRNSGRFDLRLDLKSAGCSSNGEVLVPTGRTSFFSVWLSRVFEELHILKSTDAWLDDAAEEIQGSGGVFPMKFPKY